MFDAVTLTLILLAYVGLLFAVAIWADKKAQNGSRLIDNGVVYSLSIAVYCTSWTFYGSVGKAATSGPLFLTIYFGPTLAVLLWGTVLRKLVRIKHRYRITSIADFISSRYGKSQALAAVVTVMALVGIVPYIALQLKAVNASFRLIATESESPVSGFIREHIGPLTVGLMAIFTIMFGVRRLDPTERHRGMIAALAVECLVKITAFLAAGLFVVFGMFDGPGAMFDRIEQAMRTGALASETQQPAFVTWVTYTILAASAVMFLPRQFHAAVVENSDEKHIRTARWAFPLYLFLINLFVFPIAWAGLLQGHPASSADSFVLQLPLEAGAPVLSLFVFIGGFSAATGMVMISAMTMSTMVTNHLVLPVAERVRWLHGLRRRLLQCRWAVVVLFVTAGYLFTVTVGDSYMLVNMGMMSFAAVLQFAPAIIGGLFWAGGNRVGALLGLSGGFLVWMYTLFLPALAKSGWLSEAFVTHGPLGLELLRPEALLGLSGMDKLTHSVAWSLLANIGMYVVGSLAFRAPRVESEVAEEFVSILDAHDLDDRSMLNAPANTRVNEKAEIALRVLTRYVPSDRAVSMVEGAKAAAGIDERHMISLVELADFRKEVEKVLSGSIGAAAAHQAVASAGLLDDDEADQLQEIYAKLLVELRLSPEQLRSKLSYYQEREQHMEQQAKELERVVDQRTRELADAKAVAEQASRSKSEFLANMSHEIRTPMTAILGFADVLYESGSVGNEDRQHVTTIRRNGQHLLAIINDILDLSKIEAGKLEIERVETSVVAIIREVEGLMAGRAEERGIDLRVEIETPFPATCRTDPVRLRQILVNLVGNAVKFTEDGFVAIEVACCPPGASDAEIVIRVRDSGIGITDEQAQRLFQPFSQADSSTTRRFGGTGLGLTISRRFAQLLGGDIAVTSEPGVGSCFSVTLDPGDLSTTQFVESGAKEVARTSGVHKREFALSGRVLLAEDGPDNQRLIRHVLTKAGLDVTIVENGQEAFDLAQAESFDLVLMDMQMPVMDGYTATRALRGEGYDKPIVAITAHAMASDRAKCIEAGCTDYATKPIRREVLLGAIERALEPGEG